MFSTSPSFFCYDLHISRAQRRQSSRLRREERRCAATPLAASNTDWSAARDAVCAGMDVAAEQLRDRRVAVIGAGGAARAVVAAFAGVGATVVVYNRTFERAERLAAEFDGRGGRVVAARLEKLCDSCCHVLINCTSVGMHPETDATPVDLSGSRFGPETVVFDTVYNPPQTRLMREAEAAGCRTIGGAEMFVRQAAGQFRLWTEAEAPLDVFRRVLEEKL